MLLCERPGHDECQEAVLCGERCCFLERAREDRLTPHDARRVGSGAIRDGRLRSRRDPGEKRECQLHDLPWHAVGVAQLDDLCLPAVRQMGEEVVPVPVRDRPGRLRDVAEDGEAVGGPAPDHAELHRSQVLRLVDDRVPEPLGRP